MNLSGCFSMTMAWQNSFPGRGPARSARYVRWPTAARLSCRGSFLRPPLSPWRLRILHKPWRLIWGPALPRAVRTLARY